MLPLLMRKVQQDHTCSGLKRGQENVMTTALLHPEGLHQAMCCVPPALKDCAILMSTICHQLMHGI